MTISKATAKLIENLTFEDLMALAEQKRMTAETVTVSHPVNKKSTVEKLENPLPVHTEAEHVQALKTNAKAKQGKESKRDDVKPGKKGFETKEPRKKTELRWDYIDAVTNNPKAIDAWEALTYREVQAAAKVLNVSAKGCKDDIILRGIDHKHNQKKAATKQRRLYDETLTYRQAQRLVKWYRENVPAANATLIKNIGWDNVAANCDAILDDQEFWNYVNQDEYANELNEFIGAEYIVNA